MVKMKRAISFVLFLATLILLLWPLSSWAQTTPNMNLVKPTPSVTIGPTWAQMLNTMMDVIDAHDHSSGKGVKVGPSGLDINANLPFQNHKATDLYSAQLYSQVAAITGSPEAGSLQNVGGNLYWINGSGSAVPVTSGGSVVAAVSNAFSTSTPGAYPYTVSAADAQKVLLVNTSSARTINLPAATTVVMFFIKDVTGSAGTNLISLVPNGANTIDGVNATRSLGENYGQWMLISDGVSNWSVGFMPEQPVPAGAISLYGGSTAPPGYFLCDGAAVSRTTYARLFARLGTTYGTGDGSTTFNLPDLRQRFPLGKAASGTGSALGATGGAIDHTHSVPAHYHSMGTGSTFNIIASGSHLHTVNHDHASQATDSQGSHYHNMVTSGIAGGSDTMTDVPGLYSSYDGSGSVYNYDLKTAGIAPDKARTSSNGAHTHSVDLPNFTGNSGSTTHTHVSGDFAGLVGLVTGGVDGNAAMASGTQNPPFQVVNYIIKW